MTAILILLEEFIWISFESQPYKVALLAQIVYCCAAELWAESRLWGGRSYLRLGSLVTDLLCCYTKNCTAQLRQYKGCWCQLCHHKESTVSISFRTWTDSKSLVIVSYKLSLLALSYCNFCNWCHLKISLAAGSFLILDETVLHIYSKMWNKSSLKLMLTKN